MRRFLLILNVAVSYLEADRAIQQSMRLASGRRRRLFDLNALPDADDNAGGLLALHTSSTKASVAVERAAPLEPFIAIRIAIGLFALFKTTLSAAVASLKHVRSTCKQY